MFLNRALADKESVYCVVNCHLLTYDICRTIENRLTQTADDHKDYALIFIYAEEAKDARIRAYFDKQLVKNAQPAKPEVLEQYVQRILQLPAGTQKSACLEDPDRYVNLLSIIHYYYLFLVILLL